MLTPEMSPECRAAVIVPCLNEVGLIHETAASITAAAGELLAKDQVEIVYVDGGSEDGTAQFLRGLSGRQMNLDVITELEPGIGNARKAGAALALSRAATRSHEVSDDFWIVSSDSDVIVPDSWLHDWLAVFQTEIPPIVAGSDRFPDDFETKYPNSIKVFAGAGKLMRPAAGLFDRTCIDGSNCAIERRAYGMVGPFEQQFQLDANGKKQLLAGEDYDLAARAHVLGVPIGSNETSVVTISPRRFEWDPRAFLSGSAYDGDFTRVDIPDKTADIDEHEVDYYISQSLLRYIGMSICRPIVLDGIVLGKKAVYDFLGSELTDSMNQWLRTTPRPNLFKERNDFMIDYLGSFHRAFGGLIAGRLPRSIHD